MTRRPVKELKDFNFLSGRIPYFAHLLYSTNYSAMLYTSGHSQQKLKHAFRCDAFRKQAWNFPDSFVPDICGSVMGVGMSVAPSLGASDASIGRPSQNPLQAQSARRVSP
ncbi:hypothetical protein TNCV_3248301 [Trichonephila clavipes]|nr:hypothetical protein TNCV_3248301 [Trichonephila clavipes]